MFTTIQNDKPPRCRPNYYNISVSYMVEVMDRIAARFSKEDCAKLEEMLTIVSRELMPEVDIHEASMPE